MASRWNFKGLTLSRLREANIARCEQMWHPVDAWSPTDWATAAAGELGEACNLIKKLRRGEDVPQHLIGYELADTLAYIDLLAERLGIDLEAVYREKFNIVSENVGSDVRL